MDGWMILLRNFIMGIIVLFCLNLIKRRLNVLLPKDQKSTVKVTNFIILLILKKGWNVRFVIILEIMLQFPAIYTQKK